ncbi:MAG: hypothetical protein F9B45_20435 [Phycisphaera sp. RhM]|nr:hypothetical protein [Phycisphaera sp. RhM]
MSTSTTQQKNSNDNSRSQGDFTQAATEGLQEYGSHYVAAPAKDVVKLLKSYAEEKPDVAAMWCFAFGVIVGWKLRG